MLTEDQLRRIVPNMRADRVVEYLPHLNDAMAAFEIDSPLRTAANVIAGEITYSAVAETFGREPLTDLDPDQVHTPGIYVDRIVDDVELGVELGRLIFEDPDAAPQ